MTQLIQNLINEVRKFLLLLVQSSIYNNVQFSPYIRCIALITSISSLLECDTPGSL